MNVADTAIIAAEDWDIPLSQPCYELSCEAKKRIIDDVAAGQLTENTNKRIKLTYEGW